ncbi:MAG: ATP:Cob(I)alamin adenosyltransferase, partial [uncultured Nocardioidaceae bacterium]
GQPDEDLHPHGRRRPHPARRYERDEQDGPPAARLCRCRRGELADRVRLGGRRSRPGRHRPAGPGA